MTGRSGGCVCGQLRYVLEGEPLVVHACHCSYCQRETGSAFATNLLIEADRVRFEGRGERVLTPSASGKGQVIVRCPECQVAVSSHYPGAGEAFHFIRVGTIDEHRDIAPDIHIYISTKQPWVVIPDGVPAFEEFYDPAQAWSEEMRARYRKAKER